MAVHGSPRATLEVDLLVREEDVRAAKQLASRDGETLVLELLTVTSETEDVWQSRERYDWSGRAICVASRGGIRSWKRATRRRHRETLMTRVDYSEAAITLRLRQVSQLRRLCLSLGKAKPVAPKPVAPNPTEPSR
jgi:hypothetical protein